MLRHLDALRDALQETSDNGLRGCADYVLFPLLLQVDSVAVSRHPAGGGPPLIMALFSLRHTCRRVLLPSTYFNTMAGHADILT